MKKFKKIYIEITNRCNLACSFCPRSERKKSFMRPEEFRAILGAIEGYTDHLALHVLGEPLLHPELGVLLALCQEHSLKVNLTTNGTLLPQRQELLLASPALRQVNISLHSFSEHDGDPTISGYLPEILSFIREAEATGLLISLRLWNLPPTGTSLPSPNETILKTLEYFFGLSEPLVARLTPGHGITLAPKVFLSQNNRFTWPHGPAPDLGDKGTCRGLKDHVAILANYDNLLTALSILMDDHGLGFSERRITVSTCGIVPRMDDLGRDIRVNLAVSLHSADDAVRSSLMPVNRTHGLEALLAACRRYPLGKKKVILFEYIMLKGINDSLADAHLLAEKLQGIPSRINLLPYNGSGDTEFSCPDGAQTLAFQKVLREAGFNTFIRQSRGADISAACGQLAGKG